MAKKGKSIRKKSASKKVAKKRKHKRKFRILSIDGGGIRGILPGQILVAVEKILQELSGRATARLADVFDLMAGTSTGGILTCCYLTPKPGGKRPRFSAQQAVDLYLKRGHEVFDLSFWQRVRSAGGLSDEKYSATGLENALADYFGDSKLQDLLRPSLITAYDIENRKAHFFRQHRAKKSSRYDFRVKDVARATSAAPTYFEAAQVKSIDNTTYALIDGGMFANNPTLCAYAEARNRPGRPTAKDMLILSIGTGVVEKPYPYDLAKDWGALEWIKPALDIMMSGVSETVDYQLKQIYDAVNRPNQYLRITPQLGEASPELDDVSPENLIRLRDAGVRDAEENNDALTAFATKLL